MVVETESESGEADLTIRDVQSWWQVASVVHYSSVFRQAFQLPEFNFEDFEDALLKDKPGQENLFLSYLTIDILKGCLSTDDISLLIFNDRLREFLNSSSGLCSDVQYSLNEGQRFDDLSTFKKVCLINSLCDCRLLTTDAYERTVDIDADALRIEPLGTDAKGNTYWYFFGSRLYKETAPSQKPPHVSEEKIAKKKKKRKRNSKPENNTPDFLEPSEEDLYGEWSLVASTMNEWESLAEELSQSKRSRDQELYATISENFLPVLPSVIASEEKLKLNRLRELEETRQSARIEEKRKEQELREAENEAMKRAEEHRKREVLREAAKREEEEKQKAADLERAQKEEAKALLREERQKRVAMREERATLLLEGKPLPPHLTGATLDSPCASPTHSLEEGGGSGDGAVGGNAKKSSSGSRKRYSDFLTDEDSMDEEETNLAMLKVLSELELHKDIGVFDKPVTEDIAPGYTSVIKNPICLEDIYKRVRANLYKKHSFIENCLLMFENCWQYNGKQSEYGKIATDVRKSLVDAVKRHLGVDINSRRSTTTPQHPASAQTKRRRKAFEQAVPVWYSESEDENALQNSSFSSELNSPVKLIGGAKTPAKPHNGIQQPVKDRRKQTLPSEKQRQLALNARIEQQKKPLRFWPEIDFGVKPTDRLPSLMRNDYSPSKANAVPMSLDRIAAKRESVEPSPEVGVKNLQSSGPSYNQPNGYVGRNKVPQVSIMSYSHNPAARIVMVKKPVLPVNHSNGNPAEPQIGFTPHTSKIVDVQDKEKQLTARLQQHTQETVKNFLRVARNPDCNSPANSVFPGYTPQTAAGSIAVSQCTPKTPPVVCEPLTQKVVAPGNLAKVQPQSSSILDRPISISSSQGFPQGGINPRMVDPNVGNNVSVSQMSTSALVNGPVRTVAILRKSPPNSREVTFSDPPAANQTPIRSIPSTPQILDNTTHTSNLVKALNYPDSKIVFSPIISPENSRITTYQQTPGMYNEKVMQFAAPNNSGNAVFQNSAVRQTVYTASPLVSASASNEPSNLSKLKKGNYVVLLSPKAAQQPQMQAAKEFPTPSLHSNSTPSKLVIGKNLVDGTAVTFTPLTQIALPGDAKPNGSRIQPIAFAKPAMKIPVMAPQPTVASMLRKSPSNQSAIKNEFVLKTEDSSMVNNQDNGILSFDPNVSQKTKAFTPANSNSLDQLKFIPRSPFANKPQKVRKQRVSSSNNNNSTSSSTQSSKPQSQHQSLTTNIPSSIYKTVSIGQEMVQGSPVSGNNGLVNNNNEQKMTTMTIPVVQQNQQHLAAENEASLPGNIPPPQTAKSCNNNSSTNSNFLEVSTLNSQNNTSSTYEAVKNSKAISSNEHLPLSGNPRMASPTISLNFNPG